MRANPAAILPMTSSAVNAANTAFTCFVSFHRLLSERFSFHVILDQQPPLHDGIPERNEALRTNENLQVL